MKMGKVESKISYRPLDRNDVWEIASLHLRSLQEGLLYDMGEKYARLFYDAGIGSGNCFGFAALNEAGQVVGAAVSTRDINQLYRRLLMKPLFLIGLLKRIFRLRQLYPAGNQKAEIKEEFILFFVAPKYRNLYIALNLMKMVDQKYRELGVKKYALEVKENNLTANQLYRYFGFKETHSLGRGENKRLFYVKEVRRNA